MKICSPHCGLAPGTPSGGAAYERELLLGLTRVGWDPHILLARGRQVPSELTTHVEYVRPTRGLRWPVMNLVMPYWISRCVRAHRPNVIRAHSLKFNGIAVVAAGRRAGLPTVAHLLHLEPGSNRIERYVMRAVNLVVADSQFAARQAVMLGVPADKIRVVYCGVPEHYVPGSCPEEVRQRYAIDGRVVVLSVGPLIPRKRPLEAVRMFADVARMSQASVFLWIGEGPLMRAAQNLAASLGIRDRIRFPGYVSEADKLHLYRAASIYLTPSKLEGFALGAVEAMASGVPVVALRGEASFDELIEPGISGVLTDEQSMATEVAVLLNDEARRHALGNAATDRVDTNFRVRHMVDGVREAYEEVAG